MAGAQAAASPGVLAPYRGARVLVTGGLGLVGSALARRLVCDAGAEVAVLDNLSAGGGGHWHNVADIRGRLETNIEDVRDTAAVDRLVAGRQFVFSLAAQTSHLGSMQDPLLDLAVNTTAPLALLEACRRQSAPPRVVYASTRQIYGRPRALPVAEDHPLQPVDANGVAKMAGERYHLLYQSVHGVPACALRLTNTYGPGMRIRDGAQSFLGLWIRCLLQGRPFEVWGGEQKRDFNFVGDVVEALLLAGHHPGAAGRALNLGSDDVASLQEVAQLLVRIHGGGRFEVRTMPADRQRIEIGDYWSDFGAMRQLGWEPRTSLEQGLAQTLAYYREHLEHYA